MRAIVIVRQRSTDISAESKVLPVLKSTMSGSDYARGKTIFNTTSEYIETYSTSNSKDRQYLYSSLPLHNILEQKEIVLAKDEFLLLSYNEKVIPVNIEREKLEYCRTLVYWLNWTDRTKKFTVYNDVIERSLLVLKLMSFIMEPYWRP